MPPGSLNRQSALGVSSSMFSANAMAAPSARLKIKMGRLPARRMRNRGKPVPVNQLTPKEISAVRAPADISRNRAPMIFPMPVTGKASP